MYKLFNEFIFYIAPSVRKSLLVMKLIIIFLVVGTIQVNASVFSQKLTFKQKNASLENIFEQIHRQTGYNVLCDANLIKSAPVQNVNFKAASVNQVLSAYFPESAFLITLKNNTVVIKERSISHSGTSIFENVQPRLVQGKVVDSATGEPLVGVTVKFIGSNVATTTDSDGRFKLQGDGKSIAISYIGYDSKQLDVSTEGPILIKLNATTNTLNEVIAIGYGSVQKGNVTGTISTINSDDFKDRPITQIGQAMEGKMPGVQVQATTGKPGASLQIRVRGSASITAGNDPLYVVDGVPVPDLGDISPDDVESIEVLEDAASAAIYGSRGSNGVVLVTTKKGKPGKTRIQASAMYGWQSPEKYIDMLNLDEWIDLNHEVIDKAWVNYGKSQGKNYQASDDQAFRMKELGVNSADAYPTYLYDPRWEYGSDSLDYINWQRAFFKTAPIQKYELAASGGKDNVTYRIAGNYINQDGLAVNSGYKAFSLRSNLEASLNNFIKVGLNLSPTVSKSFGAGIDGRSSIGETIAGTAPVAEKGVGLLTGVDPYPTYKWAGSQVSPVAIMENTLNETDRVRLLSNLYTDVTILKGLDAKVTGAWSFDNSNNKSYQPTKITDRNVGKPAGSASTGSRNTSTTMYYMFEALGTYVHDWNKHHLNILAGYTAEKTHFANTGQQNKGFPNDDLYTFDQGTSTVVKSSNDESEVTLLSYLARLQYNYSNKYLFSASIRRDGSSKFGFNNRWGTFPSFSGAWRISNENFMRSLSPVISDLKLKYSWGKTGNNGVGNYAAIGTINSYNYSYNGAIAVGYGPGTLANPDLKWEKTSSSNFGIDIGFLQNRLYLSADYYIKNTSDLLLSVPVAQSTGFATALENIGSVKNQGFGLSLTGRVFEQKDFTWESTVNLSHNQNKITKLGNENTPIFTGWDHTVEMKVGEPLISYVLYDAIGVYKDQADVDNSPHMTNTIPGDPKYRDINNDGKIDANDISIVGHPDPKFTWGFTNNLTYKNFDFAVFLQGQWGGQIYSSFGRNIDRPTAGLAQYNAIGKFRNRWRSANDPGDGVTPRIDASTAGLYDTRWLYSSNYWKIKNITLGYTLPKGLITGIASARVYVSAENPFMKDHYIGGYSPEAYQSTYFSDWSSYPTSKIYSLGINVNF